MDRIILLRDETKGIYNILKNSLNKDIDWLQENIESVRSCWDLYTLMNNELMNMFLDNKQRLDLEFNCCLDYKTFKWDIEVYIENDLIKSLDVSLPYYEYVAINEMGDWGIVEEVIDFGEVK